MPEVLDIETELYVKIWNLLNGYPAWAELVKRENQIRYDSVSGSESPVKPQPSDGDYPQVEMGPAVSGSTNLFAGTETFGTYSEDGTCQWTEKHRYMFLLVVTSQLLGVKETDQIGTLTRNALRKGGPRLGGIPYVSGLTLNWRTIKRNVKSTDTDETVVRFRTEITITVDCEVDGELLVGE